MSKNENANPAGPVKPDRGTSGGGSAARIETPPPADQTPEQRVPVTTKRPWSSEVIAVVSTGVALFGVIVALLVVTMTGFHSLSKSMFDQQMYRENRLEDVRTKLNTSIETIRQTVDGNLDAQNSRIRAIELGQARLEGTVEGSSVR